MTRKKLVNIEPKVESEAQKEKLVKKAILCGMSTEQINNAKDLGTEIKEFWKRKCHNGN